MIRFLLSFFLLLSFCLCCDGCIVVVISIVLFCLLWHEITSWKRIHKWIVQLLNDSKMSLFLNIHWIFSRTFAIALFIVHSIANLLFERMKRNESNKQKNEQNSANDKMKRKSKMEYGLQVTVIFPIIAIASAIGNVAKFESKIFYFSLLCTLSGIYGTLILWWNYFIRRPALIDDIYEKASEYSVYTFNGFPVARAIPGLLIFWLRGAWSTAGWLLILLRYCGPKLNLFQIQIDRNIESNLFCKKGTEKTPSTNIPIAMHLWCMVHIIFTIL